MPLDSPLSARMLKRGACLPPDGFISEPVRRLSCQPGGRPGSAPGRGSERQWLVCWARVGGASFSRDWVKRGFPLPNRFPDPSSGRVLGVPNAHSPPSAAHHNSVSIAGGR